MPVSSEVYVVYIDGFVNTNEIYRRYLLCALYLHYLSRITNETTTKIPFFKLDRKSTKHPVSNGGIKKFYAHSPYLIFEENIFGNIRWMAMDC